MARSDTTTETDGLKRTHKAALFVLLLAPTLPGAIPDAGIAAEPALMAGRLVGAFVGVYVLVALSSKAWKATMTRAD